MCQNTTFVIVIVIVTIQDCPATLLCGTKKTRETKRDKERCIILCVRQMLKVKAPNLNQSFKFV